MPTRENHQSSEMDRGGSRRRGAASVQSAERPNRITRNNSNNNNNGFNINRLVEYIVNGAELLDHRLASFPAFSQVAETFNLRPIHLTLAVFTFVFLLFGFFEDLILGFVGYCYPAWASFKSIEEGDILAAKQWLAYWMVYGFFSFLEIFSDYLLFWIPFYYVVKLLFVCWLFLPHFNGATIVYSKIVRPIMISRKDIFDDIFAQISRIKVPISPTQPSQ